MYFFFFLFLLTSGVTCHIACFKIESNWRAVIIAYKNTLINILSKKKEKIFPAYFNRIVQIPKNYFRLPIYNSNLTEFQVFSITIRNLYLHAHNTSIIPPLDILLFFNKYNLGYYNEVIYIVLNVYIFQTFLDDFTTQLPSSEWENERY